VFYLSGWPDPVFLPDPLFVEMVAGGCCLAAVGGGLLLQTRGLGRFDVSFGLRGAGLGGGLIGECFALLDPQCFFCGLAADVFGFVVALMLARPLRQPYERGGKQK